MVGFVVGFRVAWTLQGVSRGSLTSPGVFPGHVWLQPPFLDLGA